MKIRPLSLILGGLFASVALSVHAAPVKDIRVEGIERIEPGTVFSYLPVKVGEEMTEEKASAALKALYATGFFNDVKVAMQGEVLVVTVKERPAVSQLTIQGAREFSQDDLKGGLKAAGVAESRILDKSLLEKAVNELKRQYHARGYYAVEITPTVTPLERNRVSVNFAINEGEPSRIARINIVGNQDFSDKQLLGQFASTTPGLFSRFSKNDRYAREKLAADLEKLRSFYLDRGYLDFKIESTQVALSPEKDGVEIVINVQEGPKYTVSDIQIAGDSPVPEAELRPLLTLKPGDLFNRTRLVESTQAIADRLANEGYAFARIQTLPAVDEKAQQVAFRLVVEPGQRVYVRRINISGNTSTLDEVIRRELRQVEAAVYSAEKIERSKERITRLGYFSDVTIESAPVPGAPDQVDLHIKVAERPTGNIMVGAGFSSSQGLFLSAGVSQSNVFGTGNSLKTQVQTGKVNQNYSLSYTNPYHTPEGVSRGFDVYHRKLDTTGYDNADVAPYKTTTTGAGVRYVVPVSERNSVEYGLAAENTNVEIVPGSPARYVNYVNEFGNDNTTLKGTAGWASDSRDNILFPTKGRLQRISAEVGLPGGDLQYYRTNYQHQWFTPLSQNFTLMLNGELGYADGLGGQDLPFFKNFYAGGPDSIRGFQQSSIGGQDIDRRALGGTRRAVGTAEVFFPFPGMEKSKNVRLSGFVDAGNVWGGNEGEAGANSASDIRVSAGAGVTWLSPLGPLRLSVAQPVRKFEGDQTQTVQFTVGTTF